MRPLHHCRDRRFLHGILGRIEVAKSSHHQPEHLRRQVSQQVSDRKIG
jgi:hypothetical protein